MIEPAEPILDVRDLSKDYRSGGYSIVRAVDNVSFTVARGEVLGIVGESGCGKSTLARTLLRLTEPSNGEVHFEGRDLVKMPPAELKNMRRRLQIVFQDPFGSLNPRHRVKTLLSEPLRVHNVGDASSRNSRVAELLDMVGLPLAMLSRFPHEFSGGQRQRLAIARALALNPVFLIADEAVSALDVSVQSQIINLLVKLQRRLELSMLFISHDLSVIRHISDRVAVMYLGRIVEIGDTDEILSSPRHPYTQALLSAVPSASNKASRRIVLTGELPDPANPPRGCPFHTRCPAIVNAVKSRCETVQPELVAQGAESEKVGRVACHLLN